VTTLAPLEQCRGNAARTAPPSFVRNPTIAVVARAPAPFHATQQFNPGTVVDVTDETTGQCVFIDGGTDITMRGDTTW